MTTPVTIDPNGLYDATAIRLTLPISPATLARARKNGTLRFTRRGGRVFYFGRWVLDWLGEEGMAEGRKATAEMEARVV